jgi:hypothetical protein
MFLELANAPDHGDRGVDFDFRNACAEVSRASDGSATVYANISRSEQILEIIDSLLCSTIVGSMLSVLKTWQHAFSRNCNADCGT